MLSLILSLLIAAILMLVVFGLKIVPFMLGISISIGILAIWSIVDARSDRRSIFRFKSWYILWGLVSAVVLYLIFFIGNYVSGIFLKSSSEQVSVFYDLISGNLLITIPLMVLMIGPAEEIFWRGMIQRKLSKRIGDLYGWILAAVFYALVHIWAANFMLFIAALVGGLFWGWLYKRTGSLWPCIISHSIWIILAFIIFPFQ